MTADPTPVAHAASEEQPPAPPPSESPRGGLLWLLGGAALPAVPVPAAWFALANHGTRPTHPAAAPAAADDDEGDITPLVISVNTVFPKKTTLERILQQPGTVRPWAQVELYAKASGYLKSIQHLTTP